MNELIELLRSELTRAESSWSIGSFGAVGEFHQDAGEALLVDELPALTRATARGAVRLAPSAAVRAVAYEIPSAHPRRWNQAVALCLPAADAAGGARAVLTELGPDAGAIRADDRADILFDLGLALPHVDFCIRTREPGLLAVLRAACGKPCFATAAGAALSSAHPHRVVVSRLGRVEVYQKIGGADTGGVSPPGPHTHLLPRLLATRRTHAANTPIPRGYLPCAYLHPANPVMSTEGVEKPFEAAEFARFQAQLERYGAPAYVETKRRVWAALDAAQEPATLPHPRTRLARAALRNALRQAAWQSEAAGDRARAARVAAWRVHFGDVRGARATPAAPRSAHD